MLYATSLSNEAFVCSEDGFEGAEFSGYVDDLIAKAQRAADAMFREKMQEAEAQLTARLNSEMAKKIPFIKSEVEKTAKKVVIPVMIASVSIGALGLLVGGYALYKTRKRRK